MKNPFKKYREKRLLLRQERLDKENKKQLEEARVIISKDYFYGSPEETQIEQAIHILGQSDDVVSLETLLSLLTYEYADVNSRKLTEQALLSRNSQPRKRGLKRLLASSDSNGRLIVADILYQLGETNWKGIIQGNDMDFIKLLETDDPDFIEPLAAVACYRDSQLYKRLLETKTGKHFMIEALYNDLLYNSKDIRLNAVEMLAKLGEPQWKEIVRGDDFDCRRILETGHAIFSRILPDVIRNHRNLEKNPQLVAGLHHYYKEPQIIAVLMELLKHASFRVRDIAAGNLISIAKTDFSLVTKEWRRASKLIRAKRKHKKIKPAIHSDGISLSDCRDHYDSSEHLDTGIGLQIPPELKSR